MYIIVHNIFHFILAICATSTMHAQYPPLPGIGNFDIFFHDREHKKKNLRSVRRIPRASTPKSAAETYRKEQYGLMNPVARMNIDGCWYGRTSSPLSSVSTPNPNYPNRFIVLPPLHIRMYSSSSLRRHRARDNEVNLEDVVGSPRGLRVPTRFLLIRSRSEQLGGKEQPEILLCTL